MNIVGKSTFISICHSTIGNGPFSISFSTSSDFSFDKEISINESVLMERGTIKVGTNHFLMDLTSAKTYNPRISIKEANLSSLEYNFSVLLNLIRKKGNKKGLATVLDEIIDKEHSKVNTLSAFAAPYVRSLLDGIRTTNQLLITDGVKHLVGLGPGTTPAGDDFLTGLVLSLRAFSLTEKKNKYEALYSAIREISKTRTTRISREYMIYASYGFASERTKSLLECIYRDDIAALREATLRLLRIGETSGTDIATGIATGLFFCLSIN